MKNLYEIGEFGRYFYHQMLNLRTEEWRIALIWK
jgi:hypothetical protein